MVCTLADGAFVQDCDLIIPVCIVMAYIVMAYIVVVCIVMASRMLPLSRTAILSYLFDFKLTQLAHMARGGWFGGSGSGRPASGCVSAAMQTGSHEELVTVPNNRIGYCS